MWIYCNSKHELIESKSHWLSWRNVWGEFGKDSCSTQQKNKESRLWFVIKGLHWAVFGNFLDIAALLDSCRFSSCSVQIKTTKCLMLRIASHVLMITLLSLKKLPRWSRLLNVKVHKGDVGRAIFLSLSMLRTHGLGIVYWEAPEYLMQNNYVRIIQWRY